MKRISLLFLAVLAHMAYAADTNVFPPTGSVGVGTLSPQATLDVNGSIRVLNKIAQLSGGVGIQVNSGGVLNAAGLFSSYYHNDTLMGTFLDGAYARGFISNGYVNSGRSFSIGTASSSDFTTATFVPRLTVEAAGNVGIGTTAPAVKLHVKSDIFAESIHDYNQDHEIKIGSYYSSNLYGLAMGYRISGSPAGMTSRHISEYHGGVRTDLFSFNGTGNIGIGTASPTNKLTVIGTISAKEIKVTTTGADYVFAEGYNLMPIEDVERFVVAHKHLPGIMPAKEMQVGGMPVGEVVTKQLAKIEELTLYAIAADKKTEAIRQENRELKERLAIIERLLGIGEKAR